jgi:hypothetical protein
MSKLSDLVKEIPEMLSGDELIESLIVLPEYDVSVLYGEYPKVCVNLQTDVR